MLFLFSISLYLVLLDEQLYGGQVFSMVCGIRQGHPLLHPQLREKQKNE